MKKLTSLLASMTLIGSAGVVQELFCEDRPPAFAATSTKQLTVVSEDLLLDDTKRQKKLPIKVSFPKEAGTYPVIIFSHGARGSKNNYQPLIQYWVSSGYVCIQPTHSESITLMGADGSGRGNRFAQLAKLREAKSSSSKKDLLGDRPFQDWPNRPLDVSFILDSLGSLENVVPGLKGKMNMAVIGVGGHSFGAHTSQLLGGTKVGGTNKFTDRRPIAFLLISPQGREQGFGGEGGSLLDDNSWSAFTRPMLVITGTNDTGRNQQNYEWRKDPYNLSPKGDKYLLVIDGAYHHFGGIAGVKHALTKGPEDPNQVALVQRTSLLFWDSYLKKDESQKQVLKSHAVPADKSIKYVLSSK